MEMQLKINEKHVECAMCLPRHTFTKSQNVLTTCHDLLDTATFKFKRSDSWHPRYAWTVQLVEDILPEIKYNFQMSSMAVGQRLNVNQQTVLWVFHG